jgi:hypothetical protein
MLAASDDGADGAGASPQPVVSTAVAKQIWVIVRTSKNLDIR